MGLKFPSFNKPLPFPCLDGSASFASFRRFLANFSSYKIFFPADNSQGTRPFLAVCDSCIEQEHFFRRPSTCGLEQGDDI